MSYVDEMRSYISGSWNVFRKNPLLAASSFLVDFLFFLLFGTVYSFFSAGIIERLVEINNLVGELNSQVSVIMSGAEDEKALSFIVSHQEIITQHLHYIAILAAGITVCGYLLWTLFQGINWHSASWARHGRKHDFARFLGRFALLDIVWLALLGGIFYLVYKISVYNAMAAISVVGQNVINYSILVLAAVLFYFAVISYSLAAKRGFLACLRDTFVLGFRKFRYYGTAYIFVALMLVVVYYVISLLKVGLLYTVPLNLLFMLPVLAYGRVLFVDISEKIGSASDKRHRKNNKKAKKKRR